MNVLRQKIILKIIYLEKINKDEKNNCKKQYTDFFFHICVNCSRYLFDNDVVFFSFTISCTCNDWFYDLLYNYSFIFYPLFWFFIFIQYFFYTQVLFLFMMDFFLLFWAWKTFYMMTFL